MGKGEKPMTTRDLTMDTHIPWKYGYRSWNHPGILEAMHTFLKLQMASRWYSIDAIEEVTKKRAFGHYARVLFDIDLSKHIFYEVMVEQEGYAFYVKIIYK
jgi:hypothetical protein